MDKTQSALRDIMATLGATGGPRTFYPQPSPDAREVARKLLAACLSGETPVDWDEVDRLAALPDFNVTDELNQLREEVQRELIA